MTSPVRKPASIYYIFFLVLVLSTVIDEIAAISLLFNVALSSGNSLSVAGLLVAQLIPAIVFAPIGGYIVDRFGPQFAVYLFAIPQAALLVGLGTFHTGFAVYVIAALLSLCFAFTGPAIFSLLPQIAERTNLSISRTNSVIEITRGMGAIAGPILGGLLIGFLTLKITFTMTGLWSLVLPFMVFFLGLELKNTQEKSDPIKNNTNLFLDVYKPILRNKIVIGVIVAFGLIVFSTTFSDVVFIFFSVNYLGAPPTIVGLLIGAWAFGLVVGAWALGENTLNSFTPQLAYVGAIIMGLALIASGSSIWFQNSIWAIAIVLVAFCIGGFGNGIHNVAVRVSLHIYVPKGQHGRAFSLYVMVSRAASLIGFLGGGFVGADNALTVYFCSGALAIMSGTLGYIHHSIRLSRIGDAKHVY